MSETKTKKTRSTQKNTSKILKDPKVLNPNARVREKPKYKSFRFHKIVRHHEKPIISVFALTKKTFQLFSQNKKNLAIFTLIYGVLFLLFVRGIFNPVNIDDFRFELESTLGEGEGNSFSSNRIIFGQLLGSFGAGLAGEQGIYQVMLFVISALAIIWLFRQQQAGNKVNIKQAFYRGMYPLIPFTLVIYVILLQLVPAIVGNFLYSTVTANGIAVGQVEQFVWLLLYLSTLVLSFYLISSSLIALMIVTLPEMTPIRALKKAKELVTFRRLAVFRKTTGMLLIIAAIFVLLLFPALYISSILAQITFLLLSILVLPFAVGYIFVLYRELL